MKITRILQLKAADIEFRKAALEDIERRKRDVRTAEAELQRWEDETFPIERQDKGRPHSSDEKREFVGEFVVFTTPYGGEER